MPRILLLPFYLGERKITQERLIEDNEMPQCCVFGLSMLAIRVLRKGKLTDGRNRWSLHGRGGEQVGKVW